MQKNTSFYIIIALILTLLIPSSPVLGVLRRGPSANIPPAKTIPGTPPRTVLPNPTCPNGATPITAANINAAHAVGRSYRITSPGNYCLWDDVTVVSPRSNIIDITTSSVNLNLNGHTISGNGSRYAAVSNNTGFSLANKSSVFNGTISGFANGILWERQVSPAISNEFITIDHVTFNNCRTGARIIETSQPTLTNNTFINCVSGIFSRSSEYALFDQNIITIPTTGVVAIGIRAAYANHALIRSNTITQSTVSLTGHRGIELDGSSNEIYKNSIVNVGYPLMLSGTTNTSASGNNISAPSAPQSEPWWMNSMAISSISATADTISGNRIDDYWKGLYFQDTTSSSYDYNNGCRLNTPVQNYRSTVTDGGHNTWNAPGC